jgi:hypothetical protein
MRKRKERKKMTMLVVMKLLSTVCTAWKRIRLETARMRTREEMRRPMGRKLPLQACRNKIWRTKSVS